MQINDQHLLQAVRRSISEPGCIECCDEMDVLLAFSGGLDSMVLLHLLWRLRQDQPFALHAVHVHHGLQEEADSWSQQCHAQCAALDVPCTIVKVDASPTAKESPEAAARRARYTALAQILPRDGLLLTAHHQDDQAETLLLQLLRGSGVRGAAAMPRISDFAAGKLVRPLLSVSREALLAYAQAESLQWIDDPSNNDLSFDRNYLRHVVVPMLASRWPAYAQSLARATTHFAEAAGYLDELAQHHLLELFNPQDKSLSLAGLRALDDFMAQWLVRLWVQECGYPLPSRAQSEQLWHQIQSPRVDNELTVCWSGVEVRRYRDRLYVMAPLPAPTSGQWQWQGETDLALQALGGVLSVQRVTGTGLRQVACTQGVQITTRRGGEQCKPAGQAHTRDLKKLFQEHGVPPWQRRRMPLIFIAGQLAAVPGLWVCDGFAAGEAEPGWQFDWHFY